MYRGKMIIYLRANTEQWQASRSSSFWLPYLYRHQPIDLFLPHRCSQKPVESQPAIRTNFMYYSNTINLMNTAWHKITVNFTSLQLQVETRLCDTFSDPTKNAGDKSPTEVKGSRETEVTPIICFAGTY